VFDKNQCLNKPEGIGWGSAFRIRRLWVGTGLAPPIKNSAHAPDGPPVLRC